MILEYTVEILLGCFWDPFILVPDQEEQPKCQDWQSKPKRDSQPPPL